jgi:hypothetical protein
MYYINNKNTKENLMKKIYLLYAIAIISISWQAMILSMIQPLKSARSTVGAKAPRTSFQHPNVLDTDPHAQPPEFVQQNLAGKTVQKTILGKRPHSPSSELKKTKKRRQQSDNYKKHTQKVERLFHHLAWILCLFTQDRNFIESFNTKRVKRSDILNHCIQHAKEQHLIFCNVPLKISVSAKKYGNSQRLKPFYTNLQTILGIKKSGEISILSNTFVTFMDWAKKNHKATPHPADALYQEIKDNISTSNPLSSHKKKKQKNKLGSHCKMKALFTKLATLLDVGTDVRKTILHSAIKYISQKDTSNLKENTNTVDIPLSQEFSIPQLHKNMTIDQKNRAIMHNQLNILAPMVQSQEKTLIGKLQDVVTYVQEHKNQT